MELNRTTKTSEWEEGWRSPGAQGHNCWLGEFPLPEYEED